MSISFDVSTKKKGKAKNGAMFRSPAARTEVSLDERLRIRSPLFAAADADKTQVSPWIEGEEAGHIIYIGHAGRAERELVAANTGDDAVRIVVEEGIKAASAKGISKIAIYDHGGLNNRTDGVKRAQILGPWFEANDIYPIFVVWQTGFFESAADIIRIGVEKLGMAPERVEGWVADKLRDVKDRGFEVFARDFGVKAIWENMKSRAAGASRAGGGLDVAADSLRSAIGALKKPEIHLLGHSAGAIMQGYFLSAMRAKALTASSVHLWAPACTLAFATETFGAAYQNNVADPKSTFVEVLSDSNEASDPCVPLAYSKSLLYLVSRALEPDHKAPVLGMQKAWKKLPPDDMTFNPGYQNELKAWQQIAKGVVLDAPIVDKIVPTVREKNANDTISANHGSFDNNLDVVNRALRRILGKQPKAEVTDLRGF
jgi:Arc/MetJ-type ribon-helix-helix transcriptional regulator